MYYLNSDEVDSEKLYQGDIFESFPCPYLQQPDHLVFRQHEEGWAPHKEQELQDAWEGDELILVRARKHKVILISQSCDIHEEGRRNLQLAAQEQYDFQFVLYAPVIPLEQLDNFPRLRRHRAELSKQNLQSAFWLPEDSKKGIEESVVYFPMICSMVKSRNNRFLTFHPRRRLASLKSPYREAFASKIGFMFSRVALPSDVSFNRNTST